MRIATRVALLGACIAAASPALGAVISFDPDGGGSLTPINVSSFDLLPGSSLNTQLIKASPTTGVVYFQARLGSFLDGNGNVIAEPDLNNTNVSDTHRFEITVVAQLNVTVVNQNTVPGATATTILGLSVTQPTSNVKFFYDTSVDANDLAGTGFTNGTLIATASATAFTSVFTQLLTSPNSTFDNVGNNDYPGITSITGIGGGTLINATVTSVNTAWFLTPGIVGLNTNTTDVLPFNQANPSKLFTDINTLATVTPSIGSINGSTGPDLEVQTDAVSSFVTIPEPASLALLATGGAALLSRRRRK